jgi:DNA-3-methyladenine glycosylase
MIMIVKQVLSKKFYDRPVLDVGQELLGKYLVRQVGDVVDARMIVETEAYDGPNDKACHAYKGRTPRTDVMFGEAGHWYVYFVYGMHHMLNIVTGPVGYPAAVLIRGVEGINGPGRVTKQLSIYKDLNTKKAARESGLWIEDRGVAINSDHILHTPRIGIAYAEEWADKPYRFVLEKK